MRNKKKEKDDSHIGKQVRACSLYLLEADGERRAGEYMRMGMLTYNTIAAKSIEE